MRLFAALLLSDPVKQALSEGIGQLQSIGHGSFTRPENLHLTLVFLGETDRAADACAALQKLHTPPFSLTLGDWGSFPGTGKGALIWAGIRPSAFLSALAEETALLFREAGFSMQDRDFIPHITLARSFVSDENVPLHPLTPVTMPVTRVSLMVSRQEMGKTTYSELMGTELR